MRPGAATRAILAGLILAGSACHAEEPPPPPPIEPQLNKSPHERWGSVLMSDDTQLYGLVSTTPDKPIRIFDRQKSTYRDLKFENIQSIEQAPDNEWLEQEWRWREGGSDVKVFTGRFYRAALYRTVISLKDGEKITGDAVAPIHVKTGDKRHLLELHQRFKSPEPAPKDKLAPLIYIKKLVLTDQPPKPTEKAPEQPPQKPPEKKEEALGSMGAWEHVHPVHVVHRRKESMSSRGSFVLRKA